MTIRHLKVFIKVCELSSISKAAEYFMVAQPSISETIIDLEKYYGVTLFERINRKLIITKEGENLLSKAKEVVDSFDEFEELANKTNSKIKLKIGSTITFSQNLLKEVVELINNKYKEDIELIIKIDTPFELENELILGNLDVVFTERLPEAKSIDVIETAEDYLSIVSSPTYNVKNNLKLEELITYPLLTRETSSPSRYLLDLELEKIGKRIENIKMESISNSAIINFVLTDLGLGVLPYFSVKKLIANKTLKLIKLDKEIKRKLYMLTNKNKKLNKVIESILLDSYNLLKNLMN